MQTIQMRLISIFLCTFLINPIGEAIGQTYSDLLKTGSSLSPDLKFPADAKELSIFSPLEMAIYKPDGGGIFPAIVLIHTCGGLRSEIRDWTKSALNQGYVVFVLDSLSQRGLKSNCLPPNSVPVSRGAKDAFQALAHLKSFSYVDPERISLVGFSWGAVVGLMASSNEVANVLSDGSRFASSANLYPLCYFGGTAKIPATYEYLRKDTDKPTLILMGALDNETPASDCLPRIEDLKKKSAPIEAHLYPNATHCWDCSSLNGFSKVDFQGNKVVYRYDKEVTQDSANRTFEFLSKYSPPRK